MQVLRNGSKSPDVRRWQAFLAGQGHDPRGLDGKFGTDTETATKAFQQQAGLAPSGIVDNPTLGAAATLGFEIVQDSSGDRNGAGWPPVPASKPLVGANARAKVFGKFAFVHQPVPGNKENIRITDDWPKENIVIVEIPQLARVKGAPPSCKVQFHRLAEKQLRDLWRAWEKAGLLDRVETWHGSFVPRFVRESTTVLSNHAFGSAFDINMDWNKLGHEPALVGARGSVRELVEIANDHGCYWGGHFKSRRDGMHFEIAELR